MCFVAQRSVRRPISVSHFLGMKLPNFNSSINGQLSLKYRFARSLHAAASDAIEIAESPEQLGVYKAKQGDSNLLEKTIDQVRAFLRSHQP